MRKLIGKCVTVAIFAEKTGSYWKRQIEPVHGMLVDSKDDKIENE